MKKVSLLVLLAGLILPLAAQEKAPGIPAQPAKDRRLALVIGNAAYDAVPLANPVHDAQDMSALLKDAGFEVLTATDADLQTMDALLDDFQKKLKGMDSALVFYAGHGVQVQGENYLIPVHEDIRSETAVRSRGVPLSDILDRIRQSGVGTALLFLDCCRDNPFPGSSRGGAHGLTVQSVPRELESLVAYATEPGDTALDGSGRNGVFTAALLKNLSQGGLKLSEAMTQVKADVRLQTGGKQRPRVDDGLAHSYFIYNPEQISQRTRDQAVQSAAELKALDDQLADLSAKIKASQDTKARQALELEQQKQAAFQRAKKLEAEILAREAERQAQTAQEAAAEDQKRREAEKTWAAKREDLARQSALKRQQLDTLSLVTADNPDDLVTRIETLDAALSEIVARYDGLWEKAAQTISIPYGKKWDDLVKQGPDPIETDQEYADRLALEKKRLEDDRQNDLRAALKTHQAAQDAQVGDLRNQLKAALDKLESSVWQLPATAAQVQPGAWQRNARQWPVTLVSQDPALPYHREIQVDFNGLDTASLKTRYSAFDGAVKASSLTFDLRWRIQREKKRYAVYAVSAVLKDLTSGTAFWKLEAPEPVAFFSPGRRSQPQKAPELTFSAVPGTEAAEIWLGSRKLGRAPLKTVLPDGPAVFTAKWADGSFRTQELLLQTDTQPQVNFVKPFVQMLSVPGGRFTMGNSQEEDRDYPKIAIRISPFRMARSPVTVGQFKVFTAETGYLTDAEKGSFQGGRVYENGYWQSESDANWKNPYLTQDDLHPVVLVTWRDAIQFCNWLSQKEGLTPAYVLTDKEWTWNKESDGYRLPTSAEWEFAARGAKDGTGPGSRFAGSDKLTDTAWFAENSGNSTHPVNLKKPNNLGLYDLCGNVRQWCWDWDWYWDYTKSLIKAKEAVNPSGPESGMNTHIIRGGGWGGSPAAQELYAYTYSSDTIRSSDLGFRVVLPEKK